MAAVQCLLNKMICNYKDNFQVAGGENMIKIINTYPQINSLFEKHYSVAFHAIIGIVIAATIMIIPFTSFVASVGSCVVNIICLVQLNIAAA